MADKEHHPSFYEIFLAEKAKPTPKVAFLIAIGKLTGAKPGTVNQWVNGGQRPGCDALKKLCLHYGQRVGVLFPQLSIPANIEAELQAFYAENNIS